jgi:hypothetical protein
MKGFETYSYSEKTEKTDKDNTDKKEEVADKEDTKQPKRFTGYSHYDTTRAVVLAGLGLISGAGGVAAQESPDTQKVSAASPQKIKVDAQVYGADIEKEDIPTYQEIVAKQEKREKLINTISEVKILIKDGEDYNKRYLNLAELHGQEIHADGPVTGFQLESSEELDVSINENNIHSAVPEQGRRTGLQDDYTYSAARHASLPMVNSEQFTIKIGFSEDPDLLEFAVNQDVFSGVDQITFQYSDAHNLSEYVDTTQVMYLGDDWEKTVEKISNIDQKTEAAAQGAAQAEKALHANLIDTLGVIESEKANAFRARLRGVNNLHFENENKSTMFFYTELLENMSTSDLFIIGRHEALHSFMKERGYLDDKDFSKLYRETDSKIFEFVNESSYFDLPSGGHSRNSVEELATSLMNSLLDIKRLKNELAKNVNSVSEKEKILRWYKKAITIMRNYAERQIDTEQSKENEDGEKLDSFRSNKQFFQDKLNYLEKLQKRLH